MGDFMMTRSIFLCSPAFQLSLSLPAVRLLDTPPLGGSVTQTKWLKTWFSLVSDSYKPKSVKKNRVPNHSHLPKQALLSPVLQDCVSVSYWVFVWTCAAFDLSKQLSRAGLSFSFHGGAVLPGCLSLTNEVKVVGSRPTETQMAKGWCCTVTTSKSMTIVWTHLGSPSGELSQTSCRRRWVCTWPFRMHNTQWQEFLSLRQPLALQGEERMRPRHLYVEISSVVHKVHHLKTSWEGDVRSPSCLSEGANSQSE